MWSNQAIKTQKECIWNKAAERIKLKLYYPQLYIFITLKLSEKLHDFRGYNKFTLERFELQANSKSDKESLKRRIEIFLRSSLDSHTIL